MREEGGRREDAREGDGRSREAERGREREKERKREREKEREREFLGFRINSFWFLVYQFRVFGVPGLVQ